jgi:hypothetical protein
LNLDFRLSLNSSFVMGIESETRTTANMQDALPMSDLVFPSSHAKHGPPSGPVKPALQRQSVLEVLDCLDRDLSGQATLSVLPPLQK